MMNKFMAYSTILITLTAPAAADVCKGLSWQMADRCGNLKELPEAMAQTMVATSTSLTADVTLTVQNPYPGNEFAERWPDQDGPAISFIPST